MPHVNIKFFPVPLTGAQERELLDAVTTAVTKAFSVPEGVVSIALEPVPQEQWDERVVGPEFTDRKQLLRKLPEY